MKSLILYLSFFLLLIMQINCSSSDAELKDIYISAKDIWQIDNVTKEMSAGGEKDLVQLDSINFGVVAWTDWGKVIEAYKPLINYFQTFIKKPIRLVILQDDASLRNYFQIGNIQIAVASAISYTALLSQMKSDSVYYISSFLKVDQFKIYREYYNGTIFTLEKPKKIDGSATEVNDISDFSGKIMGFINPDSLAGAIYPIYTLLYKKFYPYESFSEISYLGNATNVIAAVDQGSVHVGAIESEIFDKVAAERKESSETKKDTIPIKAIFTTPCIPFEVLIANKKSLSLTDEDIKSFVKAVNSYMEQFLVKEVVLNTKLDKANADEEPEIVMDGKKGFPYSNFIIKSNDFFDDVQLVSNTVNEYTRSKQTKKKQ